MHGPYNVKYITMHGPYNVKYITMHGPYNVKSINPVFRPLPNFEPFGFISVNYFTYLAHRWCWYDYRAAICASTWELHVSMEKMIEQRIHTDVRHM